MTGYLQFNNGRRYEYARLARSPRRPNIERYMVDGREVYGIRALQLALKALVLANCDHSINTHSSFRSAKSGRCSHCGYLVERATLSPLQPQLATYA